MVPTRNYEGSSWALKNVPSLPAFLCLPQLHILFLVLAQVVNRTALNINIYVVTAQIDPVRPQIKAKNVNLHRQMTIFERRVGVLQGQSEQLRSYHP